MTATAAGTAYTDWSRGWNIAAIWEDHVERFPDAPALVHDDQTTSWADFGDRSRGVAAAMLASGVSYQDKVAQYLFNGPHYLESAFAAFRAGLVPVNTNYRYLDDELVYLWDNADVAVVVFHGAFAERVERVRPRVCGVRLWLWVDDGSAPCPEWATDYEAAAASVGVGEPQWARSGDDTLLLYTGGTTGLPKGVIWRQDDLVMISQMSSKQMLPATASRASLHERVVKPGPPSLPAAPLMHGTGALASISTLLLAGCVVTLPARGFDAEALFDAVERHRIRSLTVVGDAMSRPLIDALRQSPGRWDLGSLQVIASSGAIWSGPTQQALHRLLPGVTLMDSLGSSEALALGTSRKSADGASDVATFSLVPNARVIDENGKDVEPGSGRAGRVVLRGRIPVGYYKDPERTAATFVELDDGRYSIPGDWAIPQPGGRIRLLGRGNQCINTGGEKVYPEEVELVLKEHPAVADAAVVGLPDDRFGQRVGAVVELAAPSDPSELIEFVRTRLAAYKAPRDVVVVDAVTRGPNGKLDYAAIRSTALAALASRQMEES